MKALSRPANNWDHSPEMGFNKIQSWLKENGGPVSDEGLRKILKKLIKDGYVVKFLNRDGRPRYSLTGKGVNHILSFYWPVIDALESLPRDKSMYFLFSHFGAEYNHLERIGRQGGTSHGSFYMIPLANEIHSTMLSTMAVKMVSGELDSVISKADRSSEAADADIYLAIHYKLAELDRLMRTFSSLWANSHKSIEELYDIVANLMGNKRMLEKRDIFASIATMLVSVYLWGRNETHNPDTKKKAKELDSKLGEIFLNRMNLISDLDQGLIDAFADDIEKGRDPLTDERVASNKLILNHEYEGFRTYMIQDYITAAAIKRRDIEFLKKADRYLKGTQGLMLRTIKYYLTSIDGQGNVQRSK